MLKLLKVNSLVSRKEKPVWQKKKKKKKTLSLLKMRYGFDMPCFYRTFNISQIAILLKSDDCAIIAY